MNHTRMSGPPYSDPKLQKAYDDNVKKLASNTFITKGIAQDLVTAVMDSTIAAADAKIPEIEQRVKMAVEQSVRAEKPQIIADVTAEVQKTVIYTMLGGWTVMGLGYLLYRSVKSRSGTKGQGGAKSRK